MKLLLIIAKMKILFFDKEIKGFDFKDSKDVEFLQNLQGNHKFRLSNNRYRVNNPLESLDIR